MIYKFIDNNGSEISVNSLSSLQSLVESETVKENTKVKAGLRGKWTTASNIEELVFDNKEENKEPEETQAPQGDIKSFITKEEKTEEVSSETKLEDLTPVTKPEKPVTQPWQNEKKDIEEVNNNITHENQKPEEEIEKEIEEEKIDHTYDDENVEGISAGASIKLGFKKIFDFSGRASRSEFWWFYLTYIFLSFLVIFIIMFLAIMSDPNISDSALDSMSYIGYVTGIGTLGATVRRLHDRDISGWAILLFIIPLVNIYLIVLLFLKGTEGKNKFGDYPLSLIKK
jgi:uncharacterized membrane protein YhaH (DUF805 family)